MKYSRLFASLLLALSCCFSLAQNTTTLTGSVVDSDSQAWVNATWKATINVPGGGTAHYLSGGVVPVTFSGVLNSSGEFPSTTPVVGNTTQIIPVGTYWTYQFCSITSALCSQFNQATSGSTFAMGAYASSMITAPRIEAAAQVYAYNTTEILNPVNGTGYVNTDSATSWVYVNGYVQIGGGSGPGISLTTDNTQHASTLTGTVLNVPDYTSYFPSTNNKVVVTAEPNSGPEQDVMLSGGVNTASWFNLLDVACVPSLEANDSYQNCGVQNFDSTTLPVVPTPGFIASVYGYQNFYTARIDQTGNSPMIASGSQNFFMAGGTGCDTAQCVWIGMGEGNGQFGLGNNLIGFGIDNCAGTGVDGTNTECAGFGDGNVDSFMGHDGVGVGNNNIANAAGNYIWTGNDVAALGDQNFAVLATNATPTYTGSDDIAIGNKNGTSSQNEALTYNRVLLGGYENAQDKNVSHSVILGESNVPGNGDSSTLTEVYIYGHGAGPNDGATHTDMVAMGDAAVDNVDHTVQLGGSTMLHAKVGNNGICLSTGDNCPAIPTVPISQTLTITPSSPATAAACDAGFTCTSLGGVIDVSLATGMTAQVTLSWPLAANNTFCRATQIPTVTATGTVLFRFGPMNGGNLGFNVFITSTGTDAFFEYTCTAL